MTLACTAVLAGAGAETAFAADASSQPSAVPTTTVANGTPSAVASTLPPITARSGALAVPSPVASTPPAPNRTGGGNQITAVPSGAPNTGVPSSSNGYGEAAAVAASAAVLLGGGGTLVFRRRLKGRG